MNLPTFVGWAKDSVRAHQKGDRVIAVLLCLTTGLTVSERTETSD